ncbi:fasciclin domain-containing protein [Streptomyces sp. NPDC127190]|uniref:fasciclin domain-containing protein n=1 Tax=unclassified Streptomyces TaxID=2593676 RepID=UPI00363B3F4B
MEAAAAYPQLSQLVSAAVRAGLSNRLDGKPHITVFAPDQQAFQKVTVSQLASLLRNEGQLKKVLTYHVVDKQIAPDELSKGSFTTVEGSKLTTSGSGTDFKVNGTAKIVCGNIKAANATIYVIDTVLHPPS